jgi:hypothetical protein
LCNYHHRTFESVIRTKMQTNIRYDFNKSRRYTRIEPLETTSFNYINKCRPHIGVNLQTKGQISEDQKMA